MQTFTLSHSVAIYVPSTQGLSGKVSAKVMTARIKDVANYLSVLFGGSTSYKAKGYYRSNSGQLVVENVQIVMAYASDEDLDKNSELLLAFVDQLRKDYNQESMLLEIDKVAQIIS